jgi:DNA-binding IclR family transcriptional regulator
MLNNYPAHKRKMRITSMDAYQEIVESGKALTQEQAVFAEIKKNNGCTRQDISTYSHIPINAVCGRVNALLKLGFIYENGRINNRYRLWIK